MIWRNVQHHLPELTEARLQREPEGHILFFWASSAKFIVESPLDLDQKRGGWSTYFGKPSQPSIKDHEGTSIGSLDHMGERHWVQTRQTTGLQEFVAVGRRALQELPGFPAIILALQVRWENGVAERVNIGEIEEAAWIAADPTWKLVALR